MGVSQSRNPQLNFPWNGQICLRLCNPLVLRAFGAGKNQTNTFKIGKNKDSNFGGKYLSCKSLGTGKYLSEALIFASTNPQYDDRLFIELQVQYMKIPSSNLGRTCCEQKLFLMFRTIFVHNMFSPCSTKRRASDKETQSKV